MAALRKEGLSPRVRGNPGHLQPGRGARGSIPACAGEPGRCKPLAQAWMVYPRVCGGTRSGRGDAGRCRGSIPACAGEPEICGHRSRSPRVYPRVCGGTRRHHRHHCRDVGLSPRVRGNLVGRDRHHLAVGSIPACAGEPRSWCKARGAARVYPRVCGGTHRQSHEGPGGGGLSPRVRGNPIADKVLAHRPGSIPACAGEPCWGGCSEGG